MTKAEIIISTIKRIKRNAYKARVCNELQWLGYNTSMMKLESDTASGKAFGSMELYHEITGKSANDIYEAAVEEATQDIIKTYKPFDFLTISEKDTIVKFLNLAGYNGEVHYEASKRNMLER